jgi:sporulation protein YlmC with PRC-barrel domain
MKKTLTIIATAALMGSTVFAPLAIAQDAQPATPGTTAPATPATPAAPATTTAPAASGTAATPAATGDYLTEQSTSQISANDYIGSSIYTAADESIGSVTNLILEENGGIVAAVVGVGGFLGIGAKDVAVPMSKITVTRDTANGTIRLTTTETADSLKAAPEFKTLKDAKAAAPATPDATTTTTAPKP